MSDRVAPHVIRYSQMTPLAFEGKQLAKFFFPTNQSTYTQNANIIRILISSGSAFLDGGNSYLKATYTNTSTATQTFSNSFHSLIDRLRVVSASGMEVENILSYNHLHGCLSDLLLSPELRLTRAQEGYGHVPAPTVGTAMATADNTAVNIIAGVTASLASIVTVDPYRLGCNEITLAPNAVCNIYIPLELSQLVGANKKLIPLFLTGELQLEITLAAYPCASSDVTKAMTYSVSNVVYVGSMVEFSGSVNSALTQMTASSGLFLHSTCWSNQTVSLAAGQSSFVNSERLKSVKSILLGFTNTAVANGSRVTNRVHNGIQSLQIKIGSDYYPQQPIVADSTNALACGWYLNETFKALSVYNDVTHSGLVNIYNFATSTAASAVQVGRAVYGVDCDAFGKSDVESGVNTILSNPITVLMTGSAGSCDAHSYLLYDAIHQIKSDGSFVVVK